MPLETPFHTRTAALCTSMHWKEWAGYYAVCSYDTSHDRGYYALRNGAGLIDVTPLYKYEVRGPDAATLLSRVTVKNIRKLKVGRVTYLCWCDDQGKVVDDGTVTRMDKTWFRVTAAEPSYAWFCKFTRGLDVKIEDVSDKIAALSLQGPTSRDILRGLCDADLDNLKFFRSTTCKLADWDAVISRTGYTGDLGYEIWVENDQALDTWDALMARGKNYGLAPCGLDAMDVTRIEAGFVMNGVDYFSAHHCLIDGRKSSPYEMGLGFTVQLERDPFVGQAALMAEVKRGQRWSMVGVDIDWPDYERVCASYGLPPQVCSSAWRDGVPIYDNNSKQIGYATSGTWSPLLKKNLALATLETQYATPGTEVQIETTVEYHRHTIKAVVTKTPFFDPPRKRS